MVFLSITFSRLTRKNVWQSGGHIAKYRLRLNARIRGFRARKKLRKVAFAAKKRNCRGTLIITDYAEDFGSVLYMAIRSALKNRYSSNPPN